MPVRADSILSTITEASSSGPCVKDHYKLVVMGASRVGKSAIIQQFLYNRYPQKYVPTVEEFHSGEFDFNGKYVLVCFLVRPSCSLSGVSCLNDSPLSLEVVRVQGFTCVRLQACLSYPSKRNP